MERPSETPYDILGLTGAYNDTATRNAYRKLILQYKKDQQKPMNSRSITAQKFRLICRAYETISDRNKRKHYDATKEWAFYVPIEKYTLQQLATEPDLISDFKNRLQNATLMEINGQDPVTGQTPLYCAARSCNVAAVSVLVQEGADPDLKQRTGSTALHVSAFYGHSEIVRCLLEVGADYRNKNGFGNIAEKESYNTEVNQTFSELKQNPYVQAAANQFDWFKNNIKNISEHIDFQYGALRQTLLHCACKKGYEDLVRWLIEERSANIDIVDINANSALHLTAGGGYCSIVDYLLNRGSNPLLINRWGMTAEQNGMIHGESMKNLFQSIRARDMFKMATDGIDWWFRYHVSPDLSNAVNSNGVSLLYIACRYGQVSVAKWLLENGADVNVQLRENPKSTPLHGAAYHGHVSVVELLLSHGADVNIRNAFNCTVFEDAIKSEDVKQLLEQYRKNLKGNKLITVHLFGDGKTSGDEPLAKVQLQSNATILDLLESMPEHLRNKYNSFSIARRPINRVEQKTTLISAVCRAKYGKTRFIELPLCITVHEAPRYTNSGHIMSPELPFDTLREFHSKLPSSSQIEQIKVKPQSNQRQTYTVGPLSFEFPAECVQRDLTLQVNYILSPDPKSFNLPECLCIFITKYCRKEDILNDMPLVTLTNEPNARFYTWTETSAYWFTFSTGHTRLPSIGGIHAFIRHVEIVPKLLTLPPDMFIRTASGTALQARQHPVYCICLKLREHNQNNFPRIAYHGTKIEVIHSILMDGLVMPSTVVSSGKRVCPPAHHIPRQKEAFNIKDFSNGIFVTPSIYYCTDPVYAVPFSYGDERFLCVLECSIRDGSFGAFPSTVREYTPHQDDNIQAIEWRLTNPADIEIISILFIPIMKSRAAETRRRLNRLGINPDTHT